MEKLAELKGILRSMQNGAFLLAKEDRKEYDDLYGSWCFESVIEYIIGIINVLMEEESNV